ncbi:MAG TPA: hypothetical protein VM096_09740 [Vicinamibacterales bacterium]|nr:hypothetical protein [Vicinamibacterales bacterium]
MPPGWPRLRLNGTAIQAVITVPLFVWLYGWQTIDLVEWRTLTAAPFSVALDPSQQFLYGSPFAHMLGAYYQRQGIGVVESFVIVHGAGLLLLAYAAARGLITRCGVDQVAAGVMVIAASPLLLTMLSWIGKNDSFLLAFYLLLLSARSPLTRAILCALMILCHRELGVAMLLAHALVRGEGVAVAGGAIIGLALSYLYTNVLLDVAPVTRFDYMLAHARGLLIGVVRHPIVHFVAALGPFWIFVLRPSALTMRRLAVLGIAAAVGAMTLDFTRIFVLASAPLVIQLTEELVGEVREHGGIACLGRRWPVSVLGILAFAQLQLAGDRLSWIRGFSWTITL